MTVTKSFNVEFDDALLELDGWKKPRYEGSKLTSAEINKYTAGDITYGLNPVVESKTTALYIGTNIDTGDVSLTDNPLTEIKNHSYVTIDKILLINNETDEIEVISKENMGDVAFNRLITEDFPEGSEVNTKLLDISVGHKLKNKHFVKFNQGLLMKVYAYTANTGGFEDGVFGGFGNVENQGTFKDSLSGGGLFGFGMTSASAHSLFNTNSIQFIENLPAELSLYEGDLDTSTLGNELNYLTASTDLPYLPGNYSKQV